MKAGWLAGALVLASGVAWADGLAGGAVGCNPATGTGNCVKATSPTLVTPTLGAALATTINGVTIPVTTDTVGLLGTAQTWTALQNINLNAAAVPGVFNTRAMVITALDSSSNGFGVSAFAGTPSYSGSRSRGTNASPSAVQNGDVLTSFSGFGYGATGYSSASRANVQVVVGETWSDTAQGAYLLFNCTALTTIVTAECGRLTSTGFQGKIGATSTNTGAFTTVAIGGASIGSDALAVIGTVSISGALSAPVLTLNGNGAASNSPFLMTGTVLTSGTGTTNFPALFIQPTGTTAATTWSTNGTGLGMNLASGFAGNFLDFHVAGGASAFSVASNGSVITGARVTTNLFTITGSSSTTAWTTSGRSLVQAASTYTDTSSSGTIAAEYINAFLAPTLAFSNATTVTDPYGTYIAAPICTGGGAGNKCTATNGPWALGMDTASVGTIFRLSNPGTDAGLTDASLCRDTTVGLVKIGSGAAGICLGTSSIRFKKNLRLIPDGALPKIMDLRPTSYEKKTDTSNKRDYWLIAEQVVKVLPECVPLDTTKHPNSVDQICIETFMLKAMQEQQRVIANDNKRIARLEQQMARLVR